MRLDRAVHPRRRMLSLTPLIDVVFILLLFFMLASSLHRWQALSLVLPTTSDTATATPSAALVWVGLAGDGTLSLDGRPLSAESLQTHLRARLAADPRTRVVVEPAEGVTLQGLIRLIERLRAAGIPAIGLR